MQVAKQIHDIEADAANSESSLKAIQHHETFRTTHHTASIQFYERLNHAIVVASDAPSAAAKPSATVAASSRVTVW